MSKDILVAPLAAAGFRTCSAIVVQLTEPSGELGTRAVQPHAHAFSAIQ